MKNKIYVIILLILSVIIAISIFFPKKTYQTEIYEILNREYIEIDNNYSLKQDFKAKKNYSKIGFLLNNNGHYIKNGYVYVNIQEENKNTKTIKIKACEIEDANNFYYINYKVKKGRNYTLKIKTDSKSRISIALTNTVNDKTAFYINNKEKNKNILLAFMKTTNDYFNIWYCLLLMTLVLIYETLTGGKQNAKIK